MRLIKTLLTLVILLGVILSVSPVALKWHIQERLRDAGLTVAIKKLSLDYIFSQATIGGLEIANDRQEKITLLNAEFDFHLFALFRRELKLSELIVQDLHADLNLVEEVRSALLPERMDRSLFAGDSVWVHRVRQGQFSNLELCRTTQQQCLYVEKAALARASWESDGRRWVFRHALPVTLSKGFLRDQASGNAIFFLGEMSITEGVVSSDHINLKTVVFNNLHMVESAFMGEQLDTPFQTQIGGLTLSYFEFVAGEQQALRLGNVVGESVRQSLHRSAEGKFMLPQRMKQWFPEIQGLADRWQETVFSLESLRLNGGALAWYDKSVTPTAIANLSRIHLETGKVDTGVSAIATPVSLKAKHGDKGTIAMDGAIFFPGQSPRFNLDVNLQNIDLSGISAYTDAVLGARAQEAVLDASAVLAAENEVFNVESRWQITGLKMDSTSDKGRAIQTSFDAAKDHNQSVQVDLAYGGPVNSKETTIKHFFGTLMPAQLRQLARTSPSSMQSSPNP